MKKIEGSPKSLKQLLQNTKYSIHYYQREYMWEQKQIEELLDDLTSEFLEYYHDGDPRQAVADYGVYFMGSIVLAGRENAIIDGQQRLTSLTLLLMYLNNRIAQSGRSLSVIEQMIYSEAWGIKSFNINVDERQECMLAIFEGQPFDITAASESVRNLYNRYNDIVSLFPSEEVTDEMLLHFCDWLAEKVFFIEIVASEEQDAHKVFVTMNDRGLNLTSTEMLKGYILSEISNDERREKLNYVWKDTVLALKEIEEKGDESFIKNWLRAQYAETIRETKAGAVKEDFDLISVEFHKWVRDEKDKVGLATPHDYEDFIGKLKKYADVYKRVRQLEKTFDRDLPYVYYNAQIGFTFQMQLILAAICYEDDSQKIKEKINLVSRFVDLLVFSRVTKYRSVDYSTIKQYVFRLSKAIRRTNVETLKKVLLQEFQLFGYNYEETLSQFGLNNFTKRYIKHILARIISFMEEETLVQSHYPEYMDTRTKNPFEIEHIITNHPEWFPEYADRMEFDYYRNKIGALLLLHKSVNASLNDKMYEAKLLKYCSNEGNILSESLGEIAYENNPRFKAFITENNLPFKPCHGFSKKEIEERTALIAELSKLVWNENMFM